MRRAAIGVMHGAKLSSEGSIGLGLVVRLAGLDKSIVPAGMRVLSTDLGSIVLLRIVEDRQLLWWAIEHTWTMHV